MLARSQTSDNLCALKIINERTIEEVPEFGCVFKNEIHALKKLKHPHIVKIENYSFKGELVDEDGNASSVSYIAMEYFKNKTLCDLVIQHGRFKEDIARYYFRQLINVVEYMHTTGYAHRDIKPENLMLDDEFNLKLIDFGFATKSKTVSN